GLVILAMVSIQLVRRYRAESRLVRRIRSDHQKLEKLHADLVQANWRELEQVRRATTLGEMAAAFAHELRQPLTAVFVNAEATRRCRPGSSEYPTLISEAVANIVESAGRAQEIVSRLRRLMRQGEIQRRSIDLNEVIAEIETLLIREAEASECRILLVLAPDPLVVLGDRVQLQQVVLNLVQNGLDASRRAGEGGAPLKLRTSLAREDRQAVLEIEDSGPPIDDQTLARMFEPLFSTKAEGMGMGLALCEIIARAHGGAISVCRNPERGLTFRLTLDLASPSDTEVAA
ncbi:MAG: ATP-binding protein, partial [Holophagales bacterium]|nr:ATP-binding protein [Holophagales bacterium]